MAEAAEQALSIKWVDGGREPQSPPNPDYPDGIDLDVSRGATVTCSTTLPYPAPRCGYFDIRCAACGLSAGVTTAGRPDDPRSVKLPCRRDGAVQ